MVLVGGEVVLDFGADRDRGSLLTRERLGMSSRSVGNPHAARIEIAVLGFVSFSGVAQLETFPPPGVTLAPVPRAHLHLQLAGHLRVRDPDLVGPAGAALALVNAHSADPRLWSELDRPARAGRSCRRSSVRESPISQLLYWPLREIRSQILPPTV